MKHFNSHEEYMEYVFESQQNMLDICPPDYDIEIIQWGGSGKFKLALKTKNFPIATMHISLDGSDVRFDEKNIEATIREFEHERIKNYLKELNLMAFK